MQLRCRSLKWHNRADFAVEYSQDDHPFLKAETVFFGWKFIKDFPSSHIHKWKRFGPGLFWCITIFFKLFDVCLCNVLVLCYYFFFQLPYHYLSRQKVLTQWAQPSLHYPRSYYHLFFIGTNSMFACFQMYVKSTFSCFFFQLSYGFFLVHRHVLTQ